MTARLLILKTGSTLDSLRRRRGDFEDWIRHGLGETATRVELCRVDDGQEPPAQTGLAGVIVTGSPAMVSDRLPWSERTARWLREFVQRDRPVLGICYGHQLLAHALGGRVGANPRGREIGTVRIRLTAEAARDPLLSSLPPEFEAHASHVESVLEPPRGALTLGSTDLDPNHVIRVAARAWGLQLHPEFDRDIVTEYIEQRRRSLIQEGLHPGALIARARDTPHGPTLLRRFAEICTV